MMNIIMWVIKPQFFFVPLALAVTVYCLPSEHHNNTEHNEHPIDLVWGTPEPGKDILIFNSILVKEKVPGKVVYGDFMFNESSLRNTTLSKECPYNITAISVLHLTPANNSGYPLIVYGGLGAPELFALFISQKNEGLNFSVKVWGRPYEKYNKKFTLRQGIPELTDELLYFTNVSRKAQIGESVSETVIYEKPENKTVNITSVQAWDISRSCKLGGLPSVSSGGVGYNHVIIKVSSMMHRGFNYYILVFGKTND